MSIKDIYDKLPPERKEQADVFINIHNANDWLTKVIGLLLRLKLRIAAEFIIKKIIYIKKNY